MPFASVTSGPPCDSMYGRTVSDASAASIYGSRASNGVIVIETTKRGASGPPRRLYRATPYGRKVHGAFAILRQALSLKPAEAK